MFAFRLSKLWYVYCLQQILPPNHSKAFLNHVFSLSPHIVQHKEIVIKNDYNVNKVSEEGIRLLHTKLDHLVQQDQSDLLEIQKLQTEMLASITEQVVELQKQNKDLLEEMNALKQTQN